jgi:hypothetical protein
MLNLTVDKVVCLANGGLREMIRELCAATTIGRLDVDKIVSLIQKDHHWHAQRFRPPVAATTAA